MLRPKQERQLVKYLLMSMTMFMAMPAMGQDEPAAEDEPKDPIEVFAADVEQVDIFDPLVFGGFVESESRRIVAGEIAGTIVELKVQPGQAVKRGQTLFSIQPASAGFEYQTHRVQSPAAGVITEVMQPAGEPIQAGAPVLAIENPNNLKIGIEVTARDLPHLAAKPEMMAVAFAGSDDEVSVPASLLTMSPKASSATGTFRVEVGLDCPQSDCPAAYRLGTLVRIVLKKNLRQGIKLPLTWLYSQRRKVLVVQEDNTVQWVKVELGRYYGDQVEVLSGVEPGMKLVTSFADRPDDGDQIKIIPKEPVGGPVAAGQKPESATKTN